MVHVLVDTLLKIAGLSHIDHTSELGHNCIDARAITLITKEPVEMLSTQLPQPRT
jgi:hypothetical protein